jgi:hypothetical protein
MVLQGAKKAADGDLVSVRVTWTSVATDEVRQRWEFSRDGGGTWQVTRELVYTRRS